MTKKKRNTSPEHAQYRGLCHPEISKNVVKIKMDFEPLLAVNTNLNNICLGLECFSFLFFCLPHISPLKLSKESKMWSTGGPSVCMFYILLQKCVFGVVEIHVLKKTEALSLIHI